MQVHMLQLFPLGLRDVTWSWWSTPAREPRLLDRLRRALAGLARLVRVGPATLN